MLRILIKECILILCALYTYNRILNIDKRRDATYIIKTILFAVFLTGVSYLTVSYIPYHAVIVQIVISFIFLAVISGNFSVCFSSTVISYGISYCIYLIAGVITSVIFTIAQVDQSIDFIYPQICTCIIQTAITILLFRLKRLKRGMPFIQQSGSNTFIFYFSLIALFAFTVFSSNDGDLVYLIPVILVLFSALLVFISWKNRITKDYIKKIHVRQINTLQEEIKVQSEIITELEENIESLSKIIHKDNKLIPSMRIAVEEYLEHADSCPDMEQLSIKGRKLVQELDRIHLERKSCLSDYEVSGRKLISTNVVSIDSLMNYMLQKAKENNIDFEFKLNGDISSLIEHIISESDLNTLLADLIENAIIATGQSDRRNILTDMGITDEICFINIYDSGMPFPVHVLNNFGKKRTTIHKDTGGSGIGLMSTYEILQKYNASLVIEEYENNVMFTKKLSILFDSKKTVKIVSPRADMLHTFIKRTDFIIIEKNAPD